MRSWCLLPLQYTRRPSERRPCGCRTPAAVSRVGLLDVTPRRCGRRDMGIGWPVSQAPPPLIPVMGLAYRDRAVDDQRQVMRRITVRFEDAVTRPDCKDNRLAGDGESPGRASWTWHPWMIRRRDRRSALVLVLDVPAKVAVALATMQRVLFWFANLGVSDPAGGYSGRSGRSARITQSINGSV
jgi:hypothetical protein